MKKLTILLTLAILTMVGTVNAQNLKIKYQGDVQVGYSIGIGLLPMDRINIHMINGIRINKYLSTGLGLGVDYYNIKDADYSDSELIMPIFLNTKGYLPVSNKTSLFLSLDLGFSVGLTEGVSEMNAFMMTPAIGASFKIGGNKAMSISLGYNYQNLSSIEELGLNINAITIKAGFTF